VKLSVIVPVLDEAQSIARTLDDVLAQDAGVDLVVVDGGSRDATVALAERRARVVCSSRGRARQMNAGADVARGDALIFLHADTRLPPGALRAVSDALEDGSVVGGGFHKRFDSDAPLLRGARERTRWWFALGLVFGDQALFARSSAFAGVGGFRDTAPAEDLDLSLRLGRAGRLRLLDLEVVTSARRLERQGILRTWAGWWTTGAAQYLATRMELARVR
jgi:rSAM/selenodomain-associated transferase 2